MNTMFRMRLERVIALLLIVIPGTVGVIGLKWMKDALFVGLNQHSFSWVTFFTCMFADWHLYVGLLFFVAAAFFIGGFLFYRDSKANRIQPKLRKGVAKKSLR